MSSTPNRYSKLDGLRGLLSVMVALNHSFLVLAIPWYANIWNQNLLEFHDVQSKLNQFLSLIGNGGFAVTIFFVLSGLVMGKSLEKNGLSAVSSVVFILRRFIRLITPYIAMVTVVGIAMKFGLKYAYYPQASLWYSWWMNFEMTIKEYILNIVLYHIYIGGVTWTLRVIAFVSVVFPFLFYISKKANMFANLLFLIFLVYASFAFLSLPNIRDPRFIFMFYAGLILPQWESWFKKVPRGIITNISMLLGLAFAIYIRYQVGEYVGGVIESIYAVFLIGLLAYNDKFTLFDILNKPSFQFLGKISYSLYLLHFTVLYAVSKMLFELFPNYDYANNYLFIQTSLFAVSTLIAIPVSYLMYLWVEKPSLELTSKITHIG